MNKYLIKLASHLDEKGLHKEADYVDWIIKQSLLGFGKKYGKNKTPLKEIKQKAVEIYKSWKKSVGDQAFVTESFIDSPQLMRFVNGLGLEPGKEFSEVMDHIAKATMNLD